MSGFEMLRAVKVYNAAAAWDERRRDEQAARSNPDPAAKLDPLHADEREGVPPWLWRGAGQT